MFPPPLSHAKSQRRILVHQAPSPLPTQGKKYSLEDGGLNSARTMKELLLFDHFNTTQ